MTRDRKPPSSLLDNAFRFLNFVIRTSPEIKPSLRLIGVQIQRLASGVQTDTPAPARTLYS